MFLFSPFLPPSLCVYIIFPNPSPYLSLYPSLSLSIVSSDNVIPHCWPTPYLPVLLHLLYILCTLCCSNTVYVPDLSTIPFQTLRSYVCTWRCFATTLSEGPTAMCVVCLLCVCVFDTAYVSICVLYTSSQLCS